MVLPRGTRAAATIAVAPRCQICAPPGSDTVSSIRRALGGSGVASICAQLHYVIVVAVSRQFH